MLKKGAPPHEFGDFYHLFPIEFYWFFNRIDFCGLSTFGSGHYYTFFKTVWVPLKK